MKIEEIAFFAEDVEANIQFYKALLGSDPVAESESMAIFVAGGTKIFIHRIYKPEEGDLPPENHLAFAVEDVDMVVKQLQEQGLNVEVMPKEYYWGRSAYLRAPDGQLIELTAGEGDR